MAAVLLELAGDLVAFARHGFSVTSWSRSVSSG
jgi:hypothetical protein